MKKYNSIFPLFFFIALNFTLFSQNETKKWYFGNLAGLDFTTNPPTVLTNGALYSAEGCSSISDALGNLLFYTDGSTVWNQQHVVMANGSGLLGNGSSSQSAAIVKQPGSPNNYYIFTTDYQANSNGLRYSLVDMNMAAGMGSVTTKNSLLFTPTAEKITTVKHANGTDIWVITHDYNSNNFRTFLVTSVGLSLTPVNSAVGTSHTGAAGANALGYSKISPDGKKLAVALYNPANTFELLDFNTTTGVVSNPVTLGTNFTCAYGLEFSPDGTKLYGSLALINTQGNIYQWDICSGSGPSIIASQSLIATSSQATGALQLAPNGKIYVARYQQPTLGVINNPNALGLTCNYVDLGQSVAPKLSVWGLPNFTSSFFSTGAFSQSIITITGNTLICAGQSTTLTASGANSYTWSNSINTASVILTPSVTTTFSVMGANSLNTCAYSSYVTISVYPAFLNLTGSTSICSGQTATLLASGATSYTWSNSTTTASVTLTPSVTSTFSVTGTSTLNTCSYSSSFTINVYPIPTLSIVGNLNVCSGQTASITAIGATNYTWSNNSNNPTLFVSPTLTTYYSVTGSSGPNCSSTAATTINVLPNPVLSIIGNSIICTGETQIIIATGAISYTWSNNISGPSISVSPNVTTTYALVGANIEGCLTSSTFTLNVEECTGLNGQSGQNELKRIYPNPNPGIFEMNAETESEVNIFNNIGTIILNKILVYGKCIIDISTYADGIYEVVIINSKEIKKIRLVKKTD